MIQRETQDDDVVMPPIELIKLNYTGKKRPKIIKIIFLSSQIMAVKTHVRTFAENFKQSLL